MSTLPKRQRGVALLVALLVVALAVILIAALLDRGELALARTRNVLRSQQAQAYAQGLELYAAQILTVTSNLADTNASPWALPLPPQPVPGGMISATMRDLNGCFNLNNLGSGSINASTSLNIFRALLTHLGIDPSVAQAVQAWSGVNTGADDAGYYLALPIPYRPLHGVFAHVSELRLVRGVSGDVYARLAPYVCALPAGTTINFNTASAVLLWSLDSSLSQATAEKLWSNGQANYQGFQSFQDAVTAAGGTIPPTLSSLLVAKSSYFLARGDIVLDDIPFTFYSLIQRSQGGTGGGIRVLERSRGSDDALVAPAPVGERQPGDLLRE